MLGMLRIDSKHLQEAAAGAEADDATHVLWLAPLLDDIQAEQVHIEVA